MWIWHPKSVDSTKFRPPEFEVNMGLTGAGIGIY
jgi:hypothetical protein